MPEPITHTICPSLPDSAITQATVNIRNILNLAIKHTPAQKTIVVWDDDCDLAIAITAAYQQVLPQAHFIEFDQNAAHTILNEFEQLAPGDLVVLIQSTSFRLDAFRIRVELFKRDLKVIEHPHLSRMPGDEGLIYIESLAYDKDYFHGVGHALKARIDRATSGIINSGDGAKLCFPVGFETAKLNIGDYSQINNVGGQFPIGEVFTESKDLEAVSGRVRISIFGDTNFSVNKPDHPITLIIEKGQVVDTLNSTPEFNQVLANIRLDENDVVWVRELGLGMNRAFTQDRMVSDIGTFERMCGIHLSLGSKHGSYNKPQISKRKARHHVDVFAITESMTLDGDEIYRNEQWRVNPIL